MNSEDSRHPFIVRERQLKYYLGEFAIWIHRFQAHCAEGNWSGSAAAAADPACPLTNAGDKVVYLDSQPLEGHLPPITRSGDLIRYVPRQYRRYFIRMEGLSFEEYLSKFSSKSRATLRAKVRKFTEWRSFKTPHELREFHGLARDISKRTYQEKLHDAGLPDSPGFLEEMDRLAAQDRVRAYILFHEGQPVAYLYCPDHGGILVYEYLGYDPAHAKLSPGTVLQYLALEELFAEGRYRLFDFTQGEGSHKEYFSNGSVFCGDIFWFPRTLGNRARVAAHYRLEALSVSAVAFLDRMGVKQKIKTLLRRL